MALAELMSEAKDAVKAGKELATAKPSGLPDGVPGVRIGESVLKSRPLRLSKFLGIASRQVSRENAKHEHDAVELVRKAYDDSGTRPTSFEDNSVPFVFAPDFMDDKFLGTDAGLQLKSMMGLERAPVDPDELKWVAKNATSGLVRKAAMAAYEDAVGGTLIAPPVQGEVLPLMRNKSGVMRAGATTAPFAPNGRMVWPRMTSAPVAYWTPEEGAITENQIIPLGTGQITAQAKKLRCPVKINNELFRFSSGVADSIIQTEMAKSLSLGIDFAALYGAGSNGQPKGLIRYDQSGEVLDYAANTPAPAGLLTDGNVLKAEDGDIMLGIIEDRNFEVDTGFKWLMRSAMRARVSTIGADAVVANDEAGAFKTDRNRSMIDPRKKVWCGQEIVCSAQVLNNYTKGSGTALTEIWGGMWNELMVMMHGALEIKTYQEGQTLALSDQTLFIATLHADTVVKYAGAFVRYKQLKSTK